MTSQRFAEALNQSSSASSISEPPAARRHEHVRRSAVATAVKESHGTQALNASPSTALNVPAGHRAHDAAVSNVGVHGRPF
eukprot:CAMPEP_0206838716 /NCGR_PEP_ID=MMETSP0975-20121206/21058_1 /ASSEMBLY_ACC=CAM_ASM_000399 /TAXON_ID=483370 /ORGANISM="non described non described, Strain CCMP2097" /LENGTH=80 /DNA_ID=CAMNT_0054381161 /DNA_START=1132 /DNA_END=1374 /DNA_ORIENTATION=-